MTSVVQLNFFTDQDKNVTISVNRPRLNLDHVEVDEAMDEILNSHAVDTNGRGYLMGKRSAYFITRSARDFNIE
jgi:hypothetical protein